MKVYSKKQWSSKARCPICKKGEVAEPYNINKCDDCIFNMREALREQCIEDSKYLLKLEEV